MEAEAARQMAEMMSEALPRYVPKDVSF